MGFARQHVIITGGSSGIGQATACLLAQRRAHVSIIARR
ncbi:MAG TPA: SDR family NAD(P)-dependent oxidoreductase [Chloroflexi bacterium]|nr:SDR family NAD(P)-dependent oxidoreductase [Chloroflexota bacterium]